MPVDIFWESRGVFRRYRGDVTIAERRESFDTITADPRFDDLVYAITDYRDVIGYEITEEATEEISALHIGPLLTNPQLLIAAVVVEPRIIQAIEHFISLGFVQAPYRTFADTRSARAWVAASSRLRDVPPPRL